MDGLLLQSADCAGELFDLDPSTGTYQVLQCRAGDPAALTTRGLGHRSENQLAAAYGERGRLFLQCGGLRWDLQDPSVDLSWEPLPDQGRNTFRVTIGGREAFVSTYPSPRANAINQADPSFDPLDEELQDFFLWLTRLSRDPKWMEDMVRAWSPAEPTALP